MYAVISDGVLYYLGNNSATASTCLEQVGGNITSVDDLQGLAKALAEAQAEAKVTAFAEGLSDAAQKVLQRLKEAGFNTENAEELGATLREKGKKVIAEVRSLGIESMAAVGDGFIALGDILRKASEEQEG